MPERADGATDTSDEARDSLLEQAAALWAAGESAPADAADGVVPPVGQGPAAGEVGDLPGFLAAYYRFVPAEDLTAAGPRRVAAVAAWHAALGASRPQGRAAVQVRDAPAPRSPARGRWWTSSPTTCPTWSTR